MPDLPALYETILTLKVPSKKGWDTDFTVLENIEDLENASKNYNSKNSDKTIKIIELESKMIKVQLKVNGNKKETVRCLTSFSRYLYHTCSWNELSREQSKLFTTGGTFRALENVTEEVIKRFDDMSVIPKEISNLKEEKIEKLISDEKAIDALKVLINLKEMSNDKQKEEKEKAIITIKQILMQQLNLN